jgi:2'-5' RNA ligase
VTAPARPRLFVALELPADVRAALCGWAREHAPRGGWLRPVDAESLHVTLCFLGSRPGSEVREIAAACRRAVSGLPAPELSLGGVRWLPPRRPRVLTVELDDGADRLATVQSALSHALAAGGFYEPEPRPFLAHVTVARVQRDAHIRPEPLAAPHPARFDGADVTLFRSCLGQGPARYEALATVPLSG